MAKSQQNTRPYFRVVLSLAVVLLQVSQVAGFSPLGQGTALRPTRSSVPSVSSSPTVPQWYQSQASSGYTSRLFRSQQQLQKHQVSASTWTTALSTTSSSTAAAATNGSVMELEEPPMSDLAKKLTKIGMVAFIATVALGLITSLSLIRLLGYVGVSDTRRQRLALSTGQFCARWALRLFPFCKVDVITDKNDEGWKNPEPCIWVCNHMSMLDVFLLLASDRKMRGSKKRPIKVVYVSLVYFLLLCFNFACTIFVISSDTI